MNEWIEVHANEGKCRKKCNDMLCLKRARARAHNLLKTRAEKGP